MTEQEKLSAIIATPIGKLGISCNNGKVTAVAFLSPQTTSLPPSDALSGEVCRQMRQYFNSPHFIFQLPLASANTIFQARLRRALINIPTGETRSYGEVAKYLKSSAQAVGNACRANPLPIIIPCHRIVAIGDIGGFGGMRDGRKITIKKALLTHEQK